MRQRSLSTLERDLIYGVFRNSVNRSRVRIADTTGGDGRPWTSPPGPWSQYYIVHAGECYNSMTSTDWRRRTLIHEITHVWQGQHGIWYVFNSAYHQSLAAISAGGDVAPAYNYSVGRQWKEYNCEQQASIVEDFYRNGCQTSDGRWRYIRDNVRPGNPWV